MSELELFIIGLYLGILLGVIIGLSFAIYIKFLNKKKHSLKNNINEGKNPFTCEECENYCEFYPEPDGKGGFVNWSCDAGDLVDGKTVDYAMECRYFSPKMEENFTYTKIRNIDQVVINHYSKQIFKILDYDKEQSIIENRMNSIDNSFDFYTILRKRFKEKYNKDLPYLKMLPGMNNEIDLEGKTNDYSILLSIPSNIKEYAGVYAINYKTKAKVKVDFIYNEIPDVLIDWMYKTYYTKEE